MVNLPGWRWATIKQVALDRLSRSLHSDVCDSDGCNDVVVHSTISGRGSRRERAALNNSSSNGTKLSSKVRSGLIAGHGGHKFSLAEAVYLNPLWLFDTLLVARWR